MRPSDKNDASQPTSTSLRAVNEQPDAALNRRDPTVDLLRLRCLYHADKEYRGRVA